MIDLPIAVAEKNVAKGMRKCPQVIPAKSKRGLGMLAQRSTVMNACLCSCVKMSSLALDIRLLSLGFISSISELDLFARAIKYKDKR
jgi:hypothetical protein